MLNGCCKYELQAKECAKIDLVLTQLRLIRFHFWHKLHKIRNILQFHFIKSCIVYNVESFCLNIRLATVKGHTEKVYEIIQIHAQREHLYHHYWTSTSTQFWPSQEYCFFAIVKHISLPLPLMFHTWEILYPLGFPKAIEINKVQFIVCSLQEHHLPCGQKLNGICWIFVYYLLHFCWYSGRRRRMWLTLKKIIDNIFQFWNTHFNNCVQNEDILVKDLYGGPDIFDPILLSAKHCIV